MNTLLSDPVSPELALVCPELRERALALLPDPRPVRAPEERRPSRPDHLPPLPLRLAAYAVVRTATTAAEAAALAGLVFVVALALSGLF